MVIVSSKSNKLHDKIKKAFKICFKYYIKKMTKTDLYINIVVLI